MKAFPSTVNISKWETIADALYMNKLFEKTS